MVAMGDDDLTPDDVTGPSAMVGQMLRRGMTKRCPRCGGGKLYDGWFRMKEHCPTCGMRFEREPGFFVGAYLINFAITEGLLFLAVMGFVIVAANDGNRGLTVPLVVGLVVAVVAPILFYPFARTIWSAIDLAMRPLELDEIVEAQEQLEPEGGPAGGTPRDGPTGPLP
jgi:uncharacterized protein (DUF983 family)